MHQEVDVFLVVQNFDVGVSLLSSLTVFWLTRVDSLENAQPAEVIERQLELVECGQTSYILTAFTGFELKSGANINESTDNMCECEFYLVEALHHVEGGGFIAGVMDTRFITV